MIDGSQETTSSYDGRLTGYHRQLRWTPVYLLSMSGIVFFRTEQREAVVEFYTETVGADVWLEQPDCTILDYDGFRFGFCQREQTDDCGIITFVFDDRAGVDEVHEAVGDAALETPHENEAYDIYQFFASDPDGRTAEFQTFLHDLPE